MHRDPEGSIRRVAHFLDRPLTDDQVNCSVFPSSTQRGFNHVISIKVRLIAAHTRFDNMARNPSVNYSHWDDLGLRNKEEAPFMRNGLVGDWRSYFDPETNRRFDDFITQHLESSGLKFEFVTADEK